MSLWDVILHAMTLTAEFPLLLLGIKHLLHCLHWSTALICQDLALVEKAELVIIWQQSIRNTSYEHKACCLDK